MTSPYSVHTTPHFDRSLKKLSRRHPHLADRYAEAIDILRADPQKLIRAHNIRKLEGAQPGEGQYRLRLGHSHIETPLAIANTPKLFIVIASDAGRSGGFGGVAFAGSVC